MTETETNAVVGRVSELVRVFYSQHTEIKASHGLDHVLAVYSHARRAIACHEPPLTALQAMDVQIAALLHDVDDHKYFPTHGKHENAVEILLQAACLNGNSIGHILQMIDLVSCSKHGNSVPRDLGNDEYYKLIPRWADRLEAIGSIGVVRCYHYTLEHKQLLSSIHSPRPQTEGQVWALATPERLEAYMARGGSSTDMISHYYDKLLQVTKPPVEIVRNSYLEACMKDSATELVRVCLAFSSTGVVDEIYIQKLASNLGRAS